MRVNKSSDLPESLAIILGIFAVLAILITSFPFSVQGADPVWVSRRNDAGVVELTAVGIIPTVATTLTITEYRVKAIVLVNDTAAAVTCAIQDKSTNCNGGACSIVPSSPTALSIASGAMYTIGLYGIPVSGGITWSCSSTGVTGRVTVSQ